jgi:hypothetical protein
MKVWLEILLPLLANYHSKEEVTVSFHSKAKLVDHYIKSLNAKLYGNMLMVIDTVAALKLVDKYFKS